MPKSDSIPRCPDLPAASSSGVTTRDYSIRLITPMFGGGVEAGEPDLAHPIRGSSIRGQLQFWWRATRGRLLGRDGMWRREEEIFGSIDFPSPLEVFVSDVQDMEPFNPNEAFDRFGPGAYALFPAVENNNELLREGLSFRLNLRWPKTQRLRLMRAAQNRRRQQAHQLPLEISDITPDIDAAIWAWLTFGGLGARTRRGAGAVQCQPQAGPGKARPALDARVFIGSSQPTAVEAWREAVLVYRDFRQTPRGKKHPKTIQTRNGPKSITVPGRSHWPEADSIRQITGCALKAPAETSYPTVPADVDTRDHSTPVVPDTLLPAFPKAMLGLPINFHFSDGPGKNSPGNAHKDPQDVQLVPLLDRGGARPEPADRMASPVITRPLYVDGKWRPGIIIFNGPHLNTLEARLTGNSSMAGGGSVSVNVPHSQIADSALAGIRSMRGKASAIEALLDYLNKTVRFTEHPL